jgi:hypothetical protein
MLDIVVLQNKTISQSHQKHMKPARMREDIGCGLPLIQLGVLRGASTFFWVYTGVSYIYSHHVLRELTFRAMPAKWNE